MKHILRNKITTLAKRFLRGNHLGNMKQKDREIAYKQLKDHTEDTIGILYFECNYDEYTELHPNMTVKERNNAYAELEPPVRGVDCDVYVLADEL